MPRNISKFSDDYSDTSASTFVFTNFLEAIDEAEAIISMEDRIYQFELRHEDRFTKCSVDLRVRNGVAVDPQSCHVEDAFVYQDEEGNIFSAYLTETDVVNRKNSYYKLQVLKSSSSCSYWLLQTYGSIGAIGYMYNETEMSLLEAIVEFKRIFEKLTDNPWARRNDFEKKLGKMNIVEIEYTPDDVVDEEEISSLPESVVDLILQIHERPLNFTCLRYNPQNWPLGKLSSTQIEKAYTTLYELLGCITENNPETIIICLTNVYYSLVPQILEPGRVLDTLEAIQDEFERLDRLQREVQIYSSIDLYYSTFATKIRPIDGREEYEIIKTAIRNNGPLRIKITEIFELEDQTNLKQDQKKKLLWIGLNINDLRKILSQGLVARQGNFGLGFYLSDIVLEAIQDSQTTSNTLFIMLCEVALGHMEVIESYPSAHHRTMTTANDGYDSILACGRSEPDPKDDFVEPVSTALLSLGKPTPSPHQQRSVRNYNQYIVYNKDQVKMKYLVKICKRRGYQERK